MYPPNVSEAWLRAILDVLLAAHEPEDGPNESVRSIEQAAKIIERLKAPELAYESETEHW